MDIIQEDHSNAPNDFSADIFLQTKISSFANFNSNCFCPACSKITVAFVFGKLPSSWATFPFPKRSCCTVIPTCKFFRCELSSGAVVMLLALVRFFFGGIVAVFCVVVCGCFPGKVFLIPNVGSLNESMSPRAALLASSVNFGSISSIKRLASHEVRFPQR
jgi:hypothetical protein